MKFVLASWGTRGDVEPCAAVGRELLRRGHEVRMAVAPDVVGFAESAGLAAVAYGPDMQTVADARRGWTRFFRTPWRIRDLSRLTREIQESYNECWGEGSATLTSLADGADLLIATNVGFEMLAANVAEYYDIPLATLHWFPLRANGQLRGAARRRGPIRRSAVNLVCRRPRVPGRAGSPNADRWKSRPTTRCAFPDWKLNGHDAMAGGPLLAR